MQTASGIPVLVVRDVRGTEYSLFCDINLDADDYRIRECSGFDLCRGCAEGVRGVLTAA